MTAYKTYSTNNEPGVAFELSIRAGHGNLQSTLVEASKACHDIDTLQDSIATNNAIPPDCCVYVFALVSSAYARSKFCRCLLLP